MKTVQIQSDLMNRLRSAIRRCGNIALMFLHTLLAPCSATECNYITLTVAGVVILVGIVFRRRWVLLLTLGVLCLGLTTSRVWLEPVLSFGPTLGPCGFGPCTP